MDAFHADIRPSDGQKLFAWNGVAFITPRNWELSQSELSRGLNRIVLDDEFSPRLELEWMLCESPLDRQTVQQIFQKQAKEITEKAEGIRKLTGLSDEWTAHEYSMGNGRTLIVAYIVPTSEKSPFALFKLHFDSHSKDVPALTFHTIATTFRHFSDGPVPWSFYDVDMALDAKFRLTASSLQAGRKTLCFEWRLRRLFIWFFSLADVALKQKSLSEFAADFLNRTNVLPVPLWSPDGADRIKYRRHRLFFMGQFEEIGRLCFRYSASLHRIPQRNQIAIVVYNYRNDNDLYVLKESIQIK